LLLRASLLLGCALIGATQIRAQFSRASILGQVTDSTNAPVPNATVTITRLDTNERLDTATDASGGFSFAFLNPGVYRVTASAPGFKSLERNRLQLASDDTVALPLALAVGDVHDQVSVDATSDPLDTSNASHFTRLNPQKLVELPIMGRQAYSLVALTPGVIFTQEQFGTTGFAGLHGWDADGKFIINGGIVGTNQFLLNGAPVSLTGSWQFSPNLDGVEEFRVLTNTYDAQYGRTGGGTVMTTLKSGTNAWHDNVFEYFHNSVLDANTTQNNQSGQPRGKHNTHDYGGTVGGPLRRDHDFIFFSYEGFREIVPFPVVSDTPPVDLRTGSGFKADSIRIYDPLTAHECVVGMDAFSQLRDSAEPHQPDRQGDFRSLSQPGRRWPHAELHRRRQRRPLSLRSADGPLGSSVQRSRPHQRGGDRGARPRLHFHQRVRATGRGRQPDRLPPAADYTKYLSNATFFTRNVPNPFYGILPVTSALGASSQIQAYNLLRVAVGMSVARHPPRRSPRAALPHEAPTLDE
jgi:hypothetical protein